MNTDDNKNREDVPRDINENENGFEPAAKKIKAQEKIDIKESGFGRDFSNFQQDEHIEDNLTQIDDETIQLQQQKKENSEDLKNEINEDDNRDHHDSTQDWDAENSRTGRHK